MGAISVILLHLGLGPGTNEGAPPSLWRSEAATASTASTAATVSANVWVRVMARGLVQLSSKPPQRKTWQQLGSKTPCF